MKIDLKTLLIGLLLGVCVTLSMGQRAAPAQKLDADYRYQITAVLEGNTPYLLILDHETNKVHKRQFSDNGQGFDVKWAITPQR